MNYCINTVPLLHLYQACIKAMVWSITYWPHNVIVTLSPPGCCTCTETGMCYQFSVICVIRLIPPVPLHGRGTRNDASQAPRRQDNVSSSGSFMSEERGRLGVKGW